MKQNIIFEMISNKKKLGNLIKRFTKQNYDEESGLQDLQKYLLLKKLKLDNESQIVKISNFFNSFSKDFKLITHDKDQKNNDVNLDEIIKILKKQPENKERKDILVLKNFLVSIGLYKLFEFPNYNEKMIEKLIIFFCFNLQMQHIKRDTIIYNINDTFDKYYILIKGKLGMYKTFYKIVKFSGFRYFQYIYELYLKNEKYLLKLILEKNYKLFPIDESMMNNLNINLAKYIFNLMKTNKEYLNIFISKEDILKTCYIDPKDFSFDENENIEKKKIYDLLSQTKNKYDIYIYEYLQTELFIDKSVLETFNNNDIINKYEIRNNNISFDYKKTQNRKYALKSLSDSYICYIDLEEYIYYFIEEYKEYMHNQASFLINNFIFKRIHKHFEKYYFHYFYFEEINANEYLFKENDPIEYIYFLKEGTVELTINKNIFKINDLINKLSSNEEGISSETYKGTKEVNNKVSEIDFERGIMELEEIKKFDENKNEKIAVFEQNEIIGIECLYMGINYFYNAKLDKKKAIFYKIRKEQFLKLLDMEISTGIYLDYKKEAQRKINFFLLRLINLTKVKINCIKSKKFHNILNLYNQMNIGRNYKKVKLNITYKKTKLRLKATNNCYDDYENINITNPNNNNIFELTNYENNNCNTNKNSKNYQKRKSIAKIKNIKNSLSKKRNNTDYNLNIYNDKELMKNNKSVPKITIDNQILSLKKEEIIANRLKKRLSNDKLFFTKINKNNKFSNLQLIEKIKTLKINNSYTGDIYDNWKNHHLNINIDQASYKKKINKINWFKNIDKFPFNTEDSKEVINNKIVYGVQVDKKKVTFIQDKLFFNNKSFL